MEKQLHAYYSGRVQGVGFRFTAQDLARKLGLSGFVKNLDDGRVEIVAVGNEDKLKELLNHLVEYFSRYIQDVDVEWQEPQKNYGDFTIKY